MPNLVLVVVVVVGFSTRLSKDEDENGEVGVQAEKYRAQIISGGL